MIKGAKRILLVDDIQSQGELAYDYLKDNYKEHTIDYAKSAQEALDLFSKSFYHILILDIMMPPLPGWDKDEIKGGFLSGVRLHKEIISICENRNWKQPKLIITTALDNEDQKVLFEEAKTYFGHYMELGKYLLDKPYKPKELKEKVDALIEEDQ